MVVSGQQIMLYLVYVSCINTQLLQQIKTHQQVAKGTAASQLPTKLDLTAPLSETTLVTWKYMAAGASLTDIP